MICGDKLSSTLFRCYAIHEFVYEVLVFYPRLYIGAMLSTTLYMLILGNCGWRLGRFKFLQLQLCHARSVATNVDGAAYYRALIL